MVSMAAGEGKDEINNANRAERLLQRPQLTNLVSAQAAEKFGDNKRALKYYKRLLNPQPAPATPSPAPQPLRPSSPKP